MSKLNPLKTKHDITVYVDDKPYPIIYKALNKKIQEELEEFKEKQIASYEKYDEKRAELRELIEIKNLNSEIVKDTNLLDKAKIFFEQKEIVKQVSFLEKEIKELGNIQKQLEQDVEEYYKKQFELCVVGEGKTAFQKAIDEAGISYSIVNIHINEALKESVEKK